MAIVPHRKECVDRRRLYAREATSSMFAYWTGASSLSSVSSVLRASVTPEIRCRSLLQANQRDV